MNGSPINRILAGNGTATQNLVQVNQVNTNQASISKSGNIEQVTQANRLFRQVLKCKSGKYIYVWQEKAVQVNKWLSHEIK